MKQALKQKWITDALIVFDWILNDIDALYLSVFAFYGSEV